MLIIGINHAIKNLVGATDVIINQLEDIDRIVIAITGGSCSGKSFMADQLKESVVGIGLEVSVLNFDDYYKDSDQSNFPLDVDGRAIFDLPQSYLLDEFRHDVESLLAGNNVLSPTYDKKTNKRLVGSERLVESQPVIIVEGLFVAQALDGIIEVINVFIETDQDIRIKRRLKRDTGILHASEEETMRFILERVEPYYEEYVEPQRDLARMIVINND